MTLIANYRGIKHDDQDALLLAQRWSKYMAVTFAVGAVTGTVLSFEFGLLWPKFMGQWGAAFGVPFAFEGIFFFTEAVFISIYIFGWRRLKPWAHFWTGVPIAVAGVFGSISVVAANAWMNSPEGVTLDSAGKVIDVDPMGVIFNNAMPLMAAHMVVAAYLVGGFLIASVYAAGDAARAHATATTGWASSSGSRSRRSRPRCRWASGDALARWVFDNQPAKFASIEMVPKTSSDVPEVLLRPPQLRGRGGRRAPDPGSRLDPVRPAGRARPPSSRGSTRSRPRTGRPTHEVNVTHLAWDIMVGLGTLLFLLTLWYWASWIFRRDMPESRWFLRGCRLPGVLSVVTLEAGWTVSEVGRQPWIVYEKMKVEDAATANTGVWITFIGVVLLYVGLGVTTILVLRMMSRRFRARRAGSTRPTSPYGPSEPGDRPAEDDRTVLRDEHRRRRHPVRRDHRLRDLRRRRLRRRLLGPHRGRGRSAGERPREVIDHSIAPVWEANHVWLIFVFVVLWTCFPEAYASITLTLFVPLTIAALGIVLRGASFAFRKAVFRTRDRRNFGAAFALSSVLVPYCLGAVVGSIASGRVPVGRQGGRPVGQLGQPHVDPRRRARRVRHGVPGRVLPGLRRRPALGRDDGRLLPASGHRGRGRRRAGGRGRDLRALQRRRPTSSTDSRRAPCRW